MNQYDIKLIAMYLPQYHPIPENDNWWGEGFTEWTNVRKAEPRFLGHYQPHIPGRLGYYDLRDLDARQAQADLAREYGIHGFCYYHYWFNGKRLLETPFNEVLRTGKPNFPFCICWANENWCRRWDGSEHEILIAQQYSDEDSLDFINTLIPAFCDERYIRVNGKPLLMLYRTGLLPDPKRTTEIWRNAMQQAGVGDLYLVRVENNMDGNEVVPVDIGFDAAMEFAPYWPAIGGRVLGSALPDDMRVCDYETCMRNMIDRQIPNYKLFRGVFPSWDNSARRKVGSSLFINASPEKYAYWLSRILRHTVDTFCRDERLVFVNAWNEWGEGCHLEPDEKEGNAYLRATKLALQQSDEYAQLKSRCSSNSDQNTDAFDFAGWFRSLESVQFPLSEEGRKVFASAVNLYAGPLGTSRNDDVHRQYAHLLHEKDTMIAELLNSVSWRMTAPVRRVLDLFYKHRD